MFKTVNELKTRFDKEFGDVLISAYAVSKTVSTRMNPPPWRRNESLKQISDNESNFMDLEENLNSLLQSELTAKGGRRKFTFVAEFSLDKNELKKENEGNTPCVSVMDEKMSKDRTKRKLPEGTRKRWTKAAVWVTVICILLSFSFTIASFVSSGEYDSSSALALAFDAANALLCSLVLLWRFHGTENGILGQMRERITCLTFAASFILCGMLTTGLSLKRIIARLHPKKSFCLAAILSTGCTLYFLLSALQFWIAKKLRSSAMLGSSFDSGLSAAFMFGLLISDCTYVFAHTDLWYLDHSMAIIVSLVSVLAGVQILVEVLVYKALPLDVFSKR